MKFKLKEFLHVLFCEGWTIRSKEDNCQQVIVSESLLQQTMDDIPSPDLSPVTSLSEEYQVAKVEPAQVSQQIDIELPIKCYETEEIGVSESSKEVSTCATKSLLENKAYVALASKLAALFAEMEILDNDNSSEAVHDIIEIVEDRLKECLIASGAEPISGEDFFNISRHVTVPKSIVSKGTPILETLSPGVALGEKVLIKAKVEIKNN